jgi:predicted O-methyltransferase YrrM
MNATTAIQRRAFIKTAGTISLLGMLGSRGGVDTFAAEGAGTLTGREPLEKLLGEMESKGRQMLSVPRKDGRFLNLLVKAARARSVLEVGTSHGYSAVWISLGLEETGGKMTTVEIRPDRVQLAKENLGRAGLAHRVTFKEGDAHQIVPTLDGPFDFVFLDADKEGQLDYFNKLYPKKLTPGAIIAVHNAIRMRGSMQDYMDMIAKHPEFDTVTLSLTMEDGFELSYRHRG